MYMHVCIYIYIHRERERERCSMYIYIYIYLEREICIYTYIYIYMYIDICKGCQGRSCIHSSNRIPCSSNVCMFVLFLVGFPNRGMSKQYPLTV